MNGGSSNFRDGRNYTGKERNNEILLLPAWPCMSLRGRKLLIDGMEPLRPVSMEFH
jgi:hypothetical protein